MLISTLNYWNHDVKDKEILPQKRVYRIIFFSQNELYVTLVWLILALLLSTFGQHGEVSTIVLTWVLFVHIRISQIHFHVKLFQ